MSTESSPGREEEVGHQKSVVIKIKTEGDGEVRERRQRNQNTNSHYLRVT